MESRTKTGNADLHEELNLSEEPAENSKEGPVAKAIESKTARIPSDVFLWASLASMAVSLALQLSGKKKTKQISTFVGQWAPTLLVLGLYNKIVKVAGHDRASAASAQKSSLRPRS